MPKFQYKAKSETGVVLEGIREAASEAELIQRLTLEKTYPISVSPISEVQLNSFFRDFFHSRGVSHKDLYLFTSQLSNLLEGGLPLLRALNGLTRQIQNVKLKAIVEDLTVKIKDGATFSDALAAYPAVFSKFYLSMVRSGEASGNLDKVLGRVAGQIEKENDLRNKVIQSLIYPGIILSVGVITVLVVMTFVIPKMTLMYEDLEQQLPFLTQVLVFVSSLISRFWFLWIMAFAGLMMGAAWFFRKSREEVRFGWIALRLPLFGDVFLKEELVRFSKTLGMLLSGGVAILESLKIVCEVSRNGVFRDVIAKAQKEVGQGTPLSVYVQHLGVFPMAVTQLLEVGEETGALDQALDRVASIYEKELDQHLRMLTGLLEPALILLVGSVIGVLAIGMFLPIFEISILR